MAKKSGTLTKTEQYSLQFQDLMDAISTSTSVNYIRPVEWVLDGYIVHHPIRHVYSIGLNDTERFEFRIKAKDYKTFVDACKKRRAQILEQLKTRKK